MERDDDILTDTELSKWPQIRPDIIQQLAGKNNPKMLLPSIRQGDRDGIQPVCAIVLTSVRHFP